MNSPIIVYSEDPDVLAASVEAKQKEGYTIYGYPFAFTHRGKPHLGWAMLSTSINLGPGIYTNAAVPVPLTTEN